MSGFEIVEVDEIDWEKPAFFTERSWATAAIEFYESGERKLPDRAYAQGMNVCTDPVAIVRRRS